MEDPMRSLCKVTPDAAESQGNAARDGAVYTIRGVGNGRVGLCRYVHSGTSEDRQCSRYLGLLETFVNTRTTRLLTGDWTSEDT